MLACAESNFSNFKFKYLCENEFLRKTILACLSGAQMGSIHEKNRGQKSRDTAPLNHYASLDHHTSLDHHVGTYNIFLFSDDWRRSRDHLRHRGPWHSSVRERGEAHTVT